MRTLRFLFRLLVPVLWLLMGQATAAAFPLWSDTQVVGEIRHIKTRGDETLRDIAAQFDVRPEELERLNLGIDPLRPGAGTWITLPTQFVLPEAPRDGIVVNVAEARLYYYVIPLLGRGAEVLTFPIVLGERDWSGLLGRTRVEAKLHDAAPAVRAGRGQDDQPRPPARPAPSGDLALRLGAPGCLIESMRALPSPGERAVPACLGLREKDLRALYEEVREGTPVRIIDQPYKVGWRDGVLYLESHRSRAGEGPRSVTPAVRAVIQATSVHKPTIDWEVVRRVAEEASGVPVRISR
jgi:L,D-transpeptidase ErfK/SrfK